MAPTETEVMATLFFALAVIHTFSVKRFEHAAKNYPDGSVGENIFHLLGEVEVVFGLWAGIFFVSMMILTDFSTATMYLEGDLPNYGINFTEPAFVFVIMTMAATRPIIDLATRMIGGIAAILPFKKGVSFYLVALIVGPLLGSFITEPAAMTVTAMILLKNYYNQGISRKLKYATIGVLFVNISIGGTLTHFAAPPVLMVAGKWGWGIHHMMTQFGWKAAIAVLINAAAVTFLFQKELRGMKAQTENGEAASLMDIKWWVYALHLVFIGLVVVTAHHMVLFFGIFLFFLGVVTVTKEYQTPLKLKEGLLVGFFLAGLVTLGGFQKWWLAPLLGSLGDFELFAGTTGLTAITDNAALTYLGSLVDGLSAEAKYALVAGAVTGGGLTVIANAPNPAGFGILKKAFGDEGISPVGLLIAASGPTLVAGVCMWLLPSM